MTDIDIDFKNRDQILELVTHIPAGMIKQDKLVKHNNGVYFQEIPTDPETGIASIIFDQAEERGWNKIDLLNVHIYEKVRNEQHLNELLEREPLWELLESEDFVVGQQLFHLHDHFYLLKQMPPRSVEQLAMILAMRLPSKKYLVGKPWDEVEKDVWKPSSEYYFKHSHAISYALAVLIHMNLIIEELYGS